MKKIICFVLIMVVILSCDIQSFAITSIKSNEGEMAESVVTDTSNNSKKYDDFLKNNAFGSSNKSIVISSDCIEENNEDMVFSVDVNSNYRYYLKFKYTILDNLNTKITCSIFINDELQYDELTNCALTREYKDDGEFLRDVYDNEIKPNQISSDCDFVSLNYYMGWYKGTFSDWEEFISTIEEKCKVRSAAGKPVVMSEFGSAALYGNSNFSNDKWTMQYQSDMLSKVINECIKDNIVRGTFVWQFADIKSDVDINRARSFNNKGLLDEYRRPKMSYYTVKNLYKHIKNLED